MPNMPAINFIAGLIDRGRVEVDWTLPKRKLRLGGAIPFGAPRPSSRDKQHCHALVTANMDLHLCFPIIK